MMVDIENFTVKYITNFYYICYNILIHDDKYIQYIYNM